MDIRRSFAKLLGAVLVVGTAVVAGAPGSATGATCQSWGAQPPNRTQEINRLSGVVVLSPCRAWAVGSYNVPPVSQTLIEEWNGTAWHVQQSPNANTSTPNDLEGVTATSTKDAWAVGLFFTSGSVARTLTEHWNGTAWSLVPSPSPGTGDDLSGVDAVSPTDVWAVGSRSTTGARNTLVEHWNGVKWKVVPSPNPAGSVSNDLLHVDALSPTSVWAVGYSGPPTDRSTLVEHWNGTAWKIQQSPNTAATVNMLVDVTATSAKDVWAVGSVRDPSFASLIEHWDGSHWTIVPAAGVGSAQNALISVVATSARNAWAVGFREVGGVHRTLVEHWNGTTWKVEPTPNVGRRPNDLSSVDAASATSVWAVGAYETSKTERTLAIHCC